MQPFVALMSLVALLGGGMATGPAGQRSADGLLDLNPLIERTLSGVRPGPGLPRPVRPVAGPGDPFAGLPPGKAAAYGAGTVLHAQGVTTKLEMGLSQASFSTGALPAGQDELGHPLPSLEPGIARARGRAMEIDAGGGDSTPEEVEPAEAVAPPSKDPVTVQKSVAFMKLFEANSLAASAGARAVQNGCVIGSNIAYGIGSATDTSLADFKNDPKSDAPLLALHTEEPGPPRAVSQSQSRTFLAPAADGGPGFGLVAQTRQTVAPITLAQGTDEQLLIELGGEWVLSVFTDGAQSKVTFGVDPNSIAGKDDKWPVLRIVRGRGDSKKLFVLTVGDVSGQGGKKVVDIGGGQVTVGENPRALGDENGVQNPIETPTRSAAAADVVRISTPTGDVRIGHMEAAATVPPGGVQCPGIGMTKKSSTDTVRPGSPFSWNITVSNPNDCILRDVKIIDVPAATPGVRFTVKTTSPGSNQALDGTLTFDALDEIPMGGTRSVRIEAVMSDDASPGAITNSAKATGTCSGVVRTGSATSRTAIEAVDRPSVPGLPESPVRRSAGGGTSRVGAGAGGPEIRPAPAVPAEVGSGGAATRPPRTAQSSGASALARTGGLFGVGLGGSLIALGTVLRRRSRRTSG